MQIMYDIPPERLSPIQLAARLAREYAEHSTCCQAAAMIRDLFDKGSRLYSLIELTVQLDEEARDFLTASYGIEPNMDNTNRLKAALLSSTLLRSSPLR